jgi:hypothetical protein
MGVEKERRVPHSSFLKFLTLHLELYNLNVLMVLSKQTLDVSKEVRDSFIPDPILIKVVKYPTLTILSSSKQIQWGIVE